MSLWIVNIHGEIEGDYELVSKCEPAKTGKWLKTGQSFINPSKFRNYLCSECGSELDEHIRVELPYCPYCGIKMEGETEKEQNNLWMNMIFDQDKINAKTEQWTKEAEEAGMTLTEYLESISPLNNKESEDK